MKSRTLILWCILCCLLPGMQACRDKAAEENKQGHTGHQAAVANESKNDRITLTQRDEQYANILVDTVRFRTMAEYSTLVGTTAIDERKITVITSRLGGRLDRLFVRNPQQAVSKGQALYAIYSEELLADQNELLNSLKQQPKFNTMQQVVDQLVQGARKRLALWGLSRKQIAALEKSGKASPLVTFYSPVSGTLVELNASEGQYVETGTSLFRIADLSDLWIEAQMYSSELNWLYEHPAVTAEFVAYPGETFTLRPVFDNPAVESNQKVSLVRFRFSNSRHSLKPGMMAYVSIKRNQKKTLVIPKSSILVGNMTTAWVKTTAGVYESRMIVPGIQNKREVEVISGLKEGELVVTSGAFLLNSALVLKKGAAMPGMEM
jgi:membrane fusion protein, copper/silver efflux system